MPSDQEVILWIYPKLITTDILFDGGEGMNGVVHDPDCPCHNTITNESDVSRPND